jgi:cell division protein FtsI/penicillin-binding protein 2
MLIPKILTIIYILIALLMAILLLWAAWKHRNPTSANPLPEEIGDFGPTATNRWLKGLRGFFLLMIITLLGFHGYWAFRANSSQEFEKARLLDKRNLRNRESRLKGWVYDRTEKPENALIRYHFDNTAIVREYPLGAAAVHLTGSPLAGGFESAFDQWLTTPESTLNQLQSPNPVGKDLKVSIDSALQREAFSLLQTQLQKAGKSAAAVVLLLPNNEVLAMASAPSFDPAIVNDEKKWSELTDQADSSPEISPLVNRALGNLITTGSPAYWYRPGSTFKTFIAAVAIDCGLAQEKFLCKGEGFVPSGFRDPIRDYGGEGEVHGLIGLEEAFKKSCNQYFAQLGLKIGRERLATYARKLRFAVSPDEKSKSAADYWRVEHGSVNEFNSQFSPAHHRLKLLGNANEYDIALESIGQGPADLTVMEMALIASIAASPDGVLALPSFEVSGQRKFSEFIKPQSATKLRELMRSVVLPGGTAPGAFSGRVTGAGKTGTADRQTFLYQNGKRVVESTSQDGSKTYKQREVTDAWFIGFAPAENPQIAFAVFVEDVGSRRTGGLIAAPICAKLAEKAAQLGYVKSSSAPTQTGRPQVRAASTRR